MKSALKYFYKYKPLRPLDEITGGNQDSGRTQGD